MTESAETVIDRALELPASVFRPARVALLELGENLFKRFGGLRNICLGFWGVFVRHSNLRPHSCGLGRIPSADSLPA